MTTQLLTVSSKGQISLPVSMRKSLSIGTGDKLVAYSSGDVIMLKALRLPTEADFEAMLLKALRWAQDAGYEEADVAELVKTTRRKADTKTSR